MLRKVTIAQLRVGMYFERVEGSWLDHGLWRGKFLIADAARLAKIVDTGAHECWIDTDRGLDVDVDVDVTPADRPPPEDATAAPGTEAVVPPVIAPPVPEACTAPVGAPPAAPVSMAAEAARAARICKDARAAVASTFNDVRLGRTPNVEATRPVVEEIVASVFRHSGALVSLARLKTKDDYTYMHSVAVCALMAALGRELGFDETRCRRIGLAGLLHDLGKAMMPLEILNKPGKLTDSEFRTVRDHPLRGHALLVESGMTDADTLDVCLHHHEKMDGSGYPDRLAGDAISLAARMGAVCDVYDAVTSERSYKRPWDPGAALAAMASWTGHFDRSVFSAFIRTLGIYPPGTLVRLVSGKLAVVVESRPGDLKSPLVRVFYSTRSNEPVPVQLLDLNPALGLDRIAGAEPRETWSFPHLDKLSLPE